MPDVLLARAIKQAERSQASVRAAALLRIARVETATNPSAARNTFERGLDAVRRLSGLDGEFLSEQVALVAAVVAPDLLSSTSSLAPSQVYEDLLLNVMLDHGHLEQAVSRLMRRDNNGEFPFFTMHAVMRRADGEDVRLALFRRAIEAWRNAPPYDPMKPPDGSFIQLFQSEWNILPQAEALMVAREIVRAAVERPEQPMTASYGDGAVEITSWRAHVFFQVLHILRHLDPELADSLIAGHSQLANAARRFPRGCESMEEEAESRRRNSPPASRGGRIMMGPPEEFPYLESLHQSSLDGDFAPPLEYALKKYREDSNPRNPNLAPREFWPSASAYRSILYQAGKQLGRPAIAYLDRVPDDDLRLFALIELAAALAGLPQFHEIRREYRPLVSRSRKPRPK